MHEQSEPNPFEGDYKSFVKELGKFLHRMTSGVFKRAAELEGAKKYIAIRYLNMKASEQETASAASFLQHALRHYSAVKARFEAAGDYAHAV